jgi:uncharacterized protein
VKFSWDPRKASLNLRKHGVSFEEAATACLDPLARIHDDPEHSADEHRELLVGYSARGKLLLVSFTERDEVVRIIHSREVAAWERFDYEENVD